VSWLEAQVLREVACAREVRRLRNLLEGWREEKAKGCTESLQVKLHLGLLLSNGPSSAGGKIGNDLVRDGVSLSVRKPIQPASEMAPLFVSLDLDHSPSEGHQSGKGQRSQDDGSSDQGAVNGVEPMPSSQLGEVGRESAPSCGGFRAGLSERAVGGSIAPHLVLPAIHHIGCHALNSTPTGEPHG
jgi:hypothetical protein